MFKPIVLASLLLLVTLTEAKKCITQTVAVKAAARNGVFNKVKIPQTSLDVSTFISNLSRQGGNYSQEGQTGYGTVKGTYQISTQWCTPDSGPTDKVQILTHGIGFEKSYWDIQFGNGEYSYVNAAIAAGYSTLSFDRLGTGLSTHGEPRNEIQAPLEVNLLHELTCMLRHGKLPSAPKYKPKKVIHVGHSYGSCQTYALSNAYPTDTNGIVLTGFAFNATFLPLFLAGGDFQQARERYPDRFGKLPAGYLISGSAGADQYNFLQQDRVDPKLAEMGEKTKQPVTIGQLLTVANLPMVSKFKGPVMVIIGETDLPFCGGDCLRTGDVAVASIPAQGKKAFPNVAAKDFVAYIQPQTQHGITFHYNQTGSAGVIQNFLKSHGL